MSLMHKFESQIKEVTIENVSIYFSFNVSLAYTPYHWMINNEIKTLFVEQRYTNDGYERRLGPAGIQIHGWQIDKIVSKPDDTVKPANFIFNLDKSMYMLTIFTGQKMPVNVTHQNVFVLLQHQGKYKYMWINF